MSNAEMLSQVTHLFRRALTPLPLLHLPQRTPAMDIFEMLVLHTHAEIRAYSHINIIDASKVSNIKDATKTKWLPIQGNKPLKTEGYISCSKLTLCDYSGIV